MKTNLLLATVLLGLVAAPSRGAEGLDAPTQAKVDRWVKEVQAWASEPLIVQAVKAHNAAVPAEFTTMDQEKWKSLSILDPFVRAFSKNAVGEWLKRRRTEVVSEAFVSGADGLKVAFLAKTTNWSHKGKPKHEAPMVGKVWQGPVERDESTGLLQLQVGVPVLDGEKPIGSLVVGLSLLKLND